MIQKLTDMCIDQVHSTPDTNTEIEMLNLLEECAKDILLVRRQIKQTVDKMKEDMATLERLGREWDRAVESLERDDALFSRVSQDIPTPTDTEGSRDIDLNQSSYST